MYTYKTIIFDLNGILIKEDNLVCKSAQLYEGVKEVLVLLKNEGFTLALCTNGSEEHIYRILGELDIAQYFDIIKCTVDGLEKFQLIKQLLDENGCCSAIVVGYTNVDSEAADESRCLSIGLSYNYSNTDHTNFDFDATTPLDIHKIIKKINGVYKEVVCQILMRKQNNKPLIVGINGVDTSGKSIFTKELDRYLFKTGFKTQIVSIDDFHNPSQIRNRENDPVMSYLNNAFDVKKIEDELMNPVITNGVLNKEILLLDLESNEFINNKRYVIDGDTIVLFEGVLLYRETLNQYFDFRIFIDISFDEVLTRAVKRDSSLFGDTVIEKYINKYIPIQRLYIERYFPKDISDVIIDNNDFYNPKITKIPYLK